MHEWALAESVAATIRNEMAGHSGATLHAVNLVFGELQNIDRGIFEDGLATMLDDVPHDRDAVRIIVEPVRFRCNVCGHQWGFDQVDGLTDEHREAIHFLPEAAHAFVHCPSCSSADCQVTKGRGITLASIELNEPQPRQEAQ